ncbi:MAG: PEP-utilizing enzyme [archaeon]
MENLSEKSRLILAEFLNQDTFGANEIVVLEKNENSFLVPMCKASNAEFFEGAFSPEGPFWKAYVDLALGEKPAGKRYAVVLDGQMYFCKNIETKYIYSLGPKKNYSCNNYLLVENASISADALIRLLSAPLDSISMTKNALVDAFKVNEIFESFGDQVKRADLAVKLANNGSLGAKDASVCLENAKNVMYYSFVASLAHALKLKPNASLAPLIEETKQFLLQKYDRVSEKNCFLSKNFYDISEKPFGETKERILLNSSEEDWFVLREAAKLQCSKFLYMLRKIYLSEAKSLGLGEKVFHLTVKELVSARQDSKGVKALALKRFEEYESNQELLPKRIIFQKQWFFDNERQSVMKGVSVSTKIMQKAKVGWVHGETDLRKNFSGKIIVTDYFSPNLVTAYGGALGVISSVGGVLSHPAVIAREKDIPCIVQVDGLIKIKENDLVEIDGKTGQIKILN